MCQCQIQTNSILDKLVIPLSKKIHHTPFNYFLLSLLLDDHSKFSFFLQSTAESDPTLVFLEIYVLFRERTKLFSLASVDTYFLNNMYMNNMYMFVCHRKLSKFDRQTGG